MPPRMLGSLLTLLAAGLAWPAGAAHNASSGHGADTKLAALAVNDSLCELTPAFRPEVTEYSCVCNWTASGHVELTPRVDRESCPGCTLRMPRPMALAYLTLASEDMGVVMSADDEIWPDGKTWRRRFLPGEDYRVPIQVFGKDVNSSECRDSFFGCPSRLYHVRVEFPAQWSNKSGQVHMLRTVLSTIPMVLLGVPDGLLVLMRYIMFLGALGPEAPVPHTWADFSKKFTIEFSPFAAAPAASYLKLPTAEIVKTAISKSLKFEDDSWPRELLVRYCAAQKSGADADAVLAQHPEQAKALTDFIAAQNFSSALPHGHSAHGAALNCEALLAELERRPHSLRGGGASLVQAVDELAMAEEVLSAAEADPASVGPSGVPVFPGLLLSFPFWVVFTAACHRWMKGEQLRLAFFQPDLLGVFLLDLFLVGFATVAARTMLKPSLVSPVLGESPARAIALAAFIAYPLGFAFLCLAGASYLTGRQWTAHFPFLPEALRSLLGSQRVVYDEARQTWVGTTCDELRVSVSSGRAITLKRRLYGAAIVFLMTWHPQNNVGQWIFMSFLIAECFMRTGMWEVRAVVPVSDPEGRQLVRGPKQGVELRPLEPQTQSRAEANERLLEDSTPTSPEMRVALDSAAFFRTGADEQHQARVAASSRVPPQGYSASPYFEEFSDVHIGRRRFSLAMPDGAAIKVLMEVSLGHVPLLMRFTRAFQVIVHPDQLDDQAKRLFNRFTNYAPEAWPLATAIDRYVTVIACLVAQWSLLGAPDDHPLWVNVAAFAALVGLKATALFCSWQSHERAGHERHPRARVDSLLLLAQCGVLLYLGYASVAGPSQPRSEKGAFTCAVVSTVAAGYFALNKGAEGGRAAGRICHQLFVFLVSGWHSLVARCVSPPEPPSPGDGVETEPRDVPYWLYIAAPELGAVFDATLEGEPLETRRFAEPARLKKRLAYYVPQAGDPQANASVRGLARFNHTDLLVGLPVALPQEQLLQQKAVRPIAATIQCVSHSGSGLGERKRDSFLTLFEPEGSAGSADAMLEEVKKWMDETLGATRSAETCAEQILAQLGGLLRDRQGKPILHYLIHSDHLRPSKAWSPDPIPRHEAYLVGGGPSPGQASPPAGYEAMSQKLKGCLLSLSARCIALAWPGPADGSGGSMLQFTIPLSYVKEIRREGRAPAGADSQPGVQVVWDPSFTTSGEGSKLKQALQEEFGPMPDEDRITIAMGGDHFKLWSAVVQESGMDSARSAPSASGR